MMSLLSDWIIDSEKYEFCKSYGVENTSTMDFVERQDDFYITLLSYLNDTLNAYYTNNSKESEESLKNVLMHLVKGLLVYSQKETKNAFHGVRQINNQLYVASLYYLCDYSAIASWVMKDVRMEEYEYASGMLLSFIITGGKSAKDKDIRRQYISVFKDIEDYILTGEHSLLDNVIALYNSKYDSREFSSPTDFFMTNVLRCVLKKFNNDNIWQSLRKIDIEFDWTAYVKHSYYQHILSFLPSQQDAINKGLLSFEGSFSLKMPTSAGKSYITELLIYHEIKRNPNTRVLYLAPLRALSRELRDRFRKIHRELGFTYATKYGGSATSIVEDGVDDAQLLVATPESFMSIESSSQETLDKFSLVICDEGQLLEDRSRGINYEMLLTRLRRRNTAKFLFISAIIPNIEVVNRWLKGTDDHIGKSTYRPGKLVLTEAIVGDETVDLNVYDSSYDKVSYTISNFINKSDAQNAVLRDYDSKKGRWRVKYSPVGCTLALKSLKAGSVLLFTTAKSRGVSCTNLANHIINMIEKDAIDKPVNYVEDLGELNKIIEYATYQLGDKHLFCSSLMYGFAFHHGDIPQDLREKIERAYDKGIIRLIISNTTLAEGINLPIKTIVITHAMDQSNQGMYLPNNRLKNIIGRVGRAGRERYGTIIVPVTCSNSFLIRIIKEALDSDDSALVKMQGTLYALVEYLVKQNKVHNENDINELLSIYTFSDAIDEMIVRSAEGNVNDIDVDVLVSESLAFTLSDDVKKDALKKVFKARYNILKKTVGDERYQLSRATGLNLRELDAVEHFVTDEHVVLVTSLMDVTNSFFVSFIIDAIMALPTIQEEIKEGSATRNRLLADVDRIKRMAIMWMQGKQYWEMAKEEAIKVDEAILVVMFLQGLAHDKAVSIMSYMNEIWDIERGMAAYWPEYLRLGIDDRLMYEAHKLRIPERIQLHAIKRFYDETENWYGEYDFLKFSLIENKNNIEQYMRQKGYPVSSIEGLMDVLNYMERQNLD